MFSTKLPNPPLKFQLFPSKCVLCTHKSYNSTDIVISQRFTQQQSLLSHRKIPRPNRIILLHMYSKRYKCGGGFYIMRSTHRTNSEMAWRRPITIVVIVSIVSLDSMSSSLRVKKPSPNETSSFCEPHLNGSFGSRRAGRQYRL